MSKNKQIDPEELRYNYLGFEYTPGKLKEFWASDEEKKKFVDKIRQRLKGHHSVERDASVVNANQINKADTIAISVASVVMVISLFIPYYNFEAFGANITGGPLSFLANLGYVGNFAAWGNILYKLILALAVFMIFFSPIVGVLTFITVNTNKGKADYFDKLKKIGKLNILAILLYVILFVLVASGQSNPFGSLGIEALGENLTLGSLLGLASFSMWVNIAAHFLSSLLAMEL